MAVIEVTDVQNWLSVNKYPVAALDENLANEAQTQVFAKIGQRFSTATWTDETNTPPLVKSAVSMLAAAWEFQRSWGADAEADESGFGERLEARAWALVDGILTSALDIGLTPDPSDVANLTAAFYPTDASTRLWLEDPTADGGTPQVFTMDRQF